MILEGNYLLCDAAPWREIPGLLGESWYLEIDEELRIERLQRRHRRFGATAEVAREKALGNDQTNAEFIFSSGSRADRIITL